MFDEHLSITVAKSRIYLETNLSIYETILINISSGESIWTVKASVRVRIFPCFCFTYYAPFIITVTLFYLIV